MKKTNVDNAGKYIRANYEDDGIYLNNDDMGLDEVIFVCDDIILAIVYMPTDSQIALLDKLMDAAPGELITLEAQPQQSVIDPDLFLKTLAIIRDPKLIKDLL